MNVRYLIFVVLASAASAAKSVSYGRLSAPGRNSSMDEYQRQLQDELKKSLLLSLSMKESPVIDRSKVVIPRIMTELYFNMKNKKWDYVVRSFTHISKWISKLIYITEFNRNAEVLFA